MTAKVLSMLIRHGGRLDIDWSGEPRYEIDIMLRDAKGKSHGSMTVDQLNVFLVELAGGPGRTAKAKKGEVK